jgi:hypothetical protein
MHKDFSAVFLFRTDLPFMTWFIITKNKWIIYISIFNRLNLQFLTKTVPWTNYFWNALLLTLLHSCSLVYYTSITKNIYNNSSYDYTAWQHLLTYLLIPLSLLSFIPSICYHLLVPSCSDTMSCIHSFTHAFTPLVVHLLAYSYLRLPL